MSWHPGSERTVTSWMLLVERVWHLWQWSWLDLTWLRLLLSSEKKVNLLCFSSLQLWSAVPGCGCRGQRSATGLSESYNVLLYDYDKTFSGDDFFLKGRSNLHRLLCFISPLKDGWILFSEECAQVLCEAAKKSVRTQGCAFVDLPVFCCSHRAQSYFSLNYLPLMTKGF